MDTWIEQTERRVAILLDQMASALQVAEAHGIDMSLVRQQYQKKISEIYANEMPFSRVLDSSDLVTRFEGPAVEEGSPSVYLVSTLFNGLQKNVKSIIKSLAGLEEHLRPKWPSGVDLQLSGLARGSLVVGVKLGARKNIGSQMEIDGSLDPLFISVTEAVRSLSVVPNFVGSNSVSENIRDEMPDPAIRDAILVAAYGLCPSGKKGIDRVSFAGHMANQPVEALTPDSRRVLKNAIDKPTFETKRGEFEGIVREIDLDAHRFEIRGVEGHDSLRCIFNEMNADGARTWLNKRIIVRGQYESSANGRPRLMQVENIRISDATDKNLFE